MNLIFLRGLFRLFRPWPPDSVFFGSASSAKAVTGWSCCISSARDQLTRRFTRQNHEGYGSYALHISTHMYTHMSHTCAHTHTRNIEPEPNTLCGSGKLFYTRRQWYATKSWAMQLVHVKTCRHVWLYMKNCIGTCISPKNDFEWSGAGMGAFILFCYLQHFATQTPQMHAICCISNPAFPLRTPSACILSFTTSYKLHCASPRHASKPTDCEAWPTYVHTYIRT